MIVIGQAIRAGSAFATAVVIALTVILIAESETVLPLEPSAFNDRLSELDRRAVEQAYLNQVEHLFTVWMKDSSGQPQRATVGMRRARKAFIEANDEIDRRK